MSRLRKLPLYVQNSSPGKRPGYLVWSCQTACQVNTDDPTQYRKAIFVASAAKLAEQARGLTLLAQADLLEEAVGLARVIVEVVVNAVYLQFAEEDEVISFMRFDSLKVARYLGSMARNSNALLEADQQDADALRIAQEIGRTGRNSLGRDIQSSGVPQSQISMLG